MAETTIKTRIKLLTKSYADWELVKDTFVPLYGEMCVVEVSASAGSVAQEPCVLFKIGDGEKTFSQLPYGSALAADVYNWAKKSSLDWSDMSDTFKANVKSYISEELPSALYRLVSDGNHAWKLQKSEDGETWVDAEGRIDVTDIDAAIAKKVDKELTSTAGKALIFNELDGGGAKFENADGTWSFVGVNSGGAEGIDAQIYAINSTTRKGSRINVTTDGIFYLRDKTSAADYSAEDEIATLGDIKDISGALHFIGMTTLADGETYAQAIQRVLTEKSHTPVAGDIVIIKSADSTKEFLYDGTDWLELGDENLYATKAALAQEVADRQADVEARKLVILPVSEYGFDTNLRVNQQVAGSALVDKVIEETNINKRQAVIKTGDYKYNVMSIVDDQVLGVKGFAASTMFIDIEDLENAAPKLEKCVFLYIPSIGKTCSFYDMDLNSKEIDALIDSLNPIAYTGNVKHLTQTEGDVLILDCNV